MCPIVSYPEYCGPLLMHAPSVVSVREDPFAGPDLACSSNRATRVVAPLADGRHQHESSSLQRELPAIGLDADDDVASARPKRQLGRTGRCVTS